MCAVYPWDLKSPRAGKDCVAQLTQCCCLLAFLPCTEKKKEVAKKKADVWGSD